MAQKAVPSAPDLDESPSTVARLAAEALGTFLLVFGLIGTAIFASKFPYTAGGSPLEVGFVGVALAVGLTVVVGCYAFGPISGGHFNPAITIGLATARRFPWRDVIGYLIAQIVGGIVATSLLLAIAAGGSDGFLKKTQDAGFASNGFGDRSPGGFNLLSVILIEVILTAIFVYVVIGVTSKRAAEGFAPLAIGLTLTLIHLISIPVDNTSVNPARSIATAIYGGPDALAQLWVFLAAPIVGALIAGATFSLLFDRTVKRSPQTQTAG